MSVKVLNVITGGLGREGITTTQLEFMKGMDKSEIQMDIAAVHDNEEDVISEFEATGCRVMRFPDRKRELLAYMKQLNHRIRREHYDVIHVHGSSSMMSIELLIAKFAGVKTRIAHSRNTRADHEKVDKLLRPVFDHCYTHAFSCGEDAGKWLFGDKEFTVLHNGKNLEKFHFYQEQRDSIRTKYAIGNKTAVGFVGNLNVQKNLPFLLDVIRHNNISNPDCIYFLMGDGPERENVRAKLEEYGLSDNVIMTGRIPNIPEMLQGMDVMLLPSLFEGLPNVVLEWQAAGLPSLISDQITQECKVSNLVKFLPINQGTEIWVKEIEKVSINNDRKTYSEDACRCMKAAGFDLEENIEFVRKFYVEAAQR
ncbi:glycosyltransferase family 1 protein [Bacillus sp. ISL-40]|uniref:glycosyltransferase family 1 protein n=1 Tax=unclassified Bacillus (in: firmicutes) TaxID=185979 RepID=UPI001BE8E41C|nr:MULTISPECIES: glycosyltransferase family 1 protein [unclassified Bacillus (in: firmicutes)]MBT2701019.1 glycosyltransferase family 1 protein [Bacillus sp. ISL-40]MBT2739325.1 glycosyltransferase family 1 protein [Bacillus sp. ISL-77]